MNDQQQSRADALTDDQRQALGEAISEYFEKLDSDEGIRTPEGRILRAFDYCDSRNVDDLIDRAILPALATSANETGAEGAKPVAWFIDWPDEPELGHYFAEEPCDPKYGRSRALGFIESRSPAMAAAAPADERAAFEKVFPMPADCQRIGSGPTAGYAPTEYGAWEAHDFIRRWEGWKARAAASPAAEAVTDALIRTVATQYFQYDADGQSYNILRYECEEDFFNCIHAILAARQPAQADTIQCQAHSGPGCTECGGTGIWPAQADAPADTACPHAGVHRYCMSCPVSPCPIGLGEKK